MRCLAISLALALGACRNGDPPPAPTRTPPPRDAQPAIARDVADDSSDFAALDDVFGGDGLISGFDPAKVVGKSPASLKKALPSSFTIDSICDDTACSAEAPLPKGRKLSIGVVRAWGGNVLVSFELHGPQLLHLYSRLETALGGSEIVDKKKTSSQTRVYTHNSLRYVMRANPSNWGVTIKITKIEDAERFFD